MHFVAKWGRKLTAMLSQMLVTCLFVKVCERRAIQIMCKQPKRRFPEPSIGKRPSNVFLSKFIFCCLDAITPISTQNSSFVPTGLPSPHLCWMPSCENLLRSPPYFRMMSASMNLFSLLLCRLNSQHRVEDVFYQRIMGCRDSILH
jgi:hypothetical protein